MHTYVYICIMCYIYVYTYAVKEGVCGKSVTNSCQCQRELEHNQVKNLLQDLFDVLLLLLLKRIADYLGCFRFSAQ